MTDFDRFAEKVARNALIFERHIAMTGGARLGAARRRKIVDLVEGHGSLAVRELSNELGVSEATIRRDLRVLGESGALMRTHGGAVKDASAFVDLPNEERMLVHAEEKGRIGRCAIEVLAGHEVVFLDAGTTALAVAEYAHRKPNCRYVTTCLKIASRLRDQKIPNFYLIGGAYVAVNDSFGGRLAIAAIRTLSFDVSFLCCSAIDVERGSISIGDEVYSQVHAEAVAATRRNIVVAHHEKLDACGFIRTSSFDEIDSLITDQWLSLENRTCLERANIEVILA